MGVEKQTIRDEICRRFDIPPESLSDDDNLFRGFIDSLSFLDYAKLVQAIAQKSGKQFDLEHFLLSEVFSINAITSYLETSHS